MNCSNSAQVSSKEVDCQMAIFMIKVLCVLYWRYDGAFIELSCVTKYIDIMIFIPSRWRMFCNVNLSIYTNRLIQHFEKFRCTESDRTTPVCTTGEK